MTKKTNFTLNPNNNVNCKLIIPAQIKEEIDMYHQNYPGREWSGPIFYDIVEGSFTEGDLVLRINDLAIADAGSETYTDYSFNELMKNDFWFEKQASHKFGGLHTHHNMNCFFSGTDNEELVDNTHRYIHADDFYLSVIVNAKGTGEWIARICKRISSKVTVTEEKVTRTYIQEFEEKYPWLTSRYEMNDQGEIVPKTEVVPTKTSSIIDREEYLYTDCDLVFEDSPVDYKQCLSRLQEFLKVKEKKTSYSSTSTYQNRHNPAGSFGNHYASASKHEDADDEEFAYLKSTIHTNFTKLYHFKDNYRNWDKTKDAPNGYSLLESKFLLEWFHEVCEKFYDHFSDVKTKVPTTAQLTTIIKDLDRFEKTFFKTIPGKSRHESDVYIKTRIKDLKLFRDLFLDQYWKETRLKISHE